MPLSLSGQDLQMKDRNVCHAAAEAAWRLREMVAPALLRHERKEFYKQALKLCRSLIESCRRQAGREKMRIRPSLN
jgi:hypothetical protein